MSVYLNAQQRDEKKKKKEVTVPLSGLPQCTLRCYSLWPPSLQKYTALHADTSSVPDGCAYGLGCRFNPRAQEIQASEDKKSMKEV